MKRRSLIVPPSQWMPDISPVSPPALPVVAERGGTQLRTPLPVLVVDTREQDPLDFEPYQHWFSGIRRKALEVGDYSIEGMERNCAVERKSLSDLVRSFTEDRQRFVARLKEMATFSTRLLVVVASAGKVLTPYEFSPARPNQIMQSLEAVMVGLRIPVLFAETHEIASRMTAWHLYVAHLYEWLEQNGYERVLADNDL